MKYAYDEYYKTKKRGYTDAEFKAALEKFAGIKLDEFYEKYINGVENIDYNKYLGYAGYKLVDDLTAKKDPSLGITVVNTNGKIMVSNVARNGAGWLNGINVNDELSAIEGNAVTELDKYLTTKRLGDKVNVTVMRDGIMMVLPVTLLRNPTVKYHIDDNGTPTAAMLAVRKKWMHL
jgi:predicted metalloprotease with PDZ domain